jgi:hypothetical protein
VKYLNLNKDVKTKQKGGKSNKETWYLYVLENGCCL